MGKAWLKPDETQKAYVPFENYEQAVAKAQAKIISLNKEIVELDNLKEQVKVGIHEVLQAKAAELDRIIAEQNAVKQTIVKSTSEAINKAADADFRLKNLQSDRDAHENEVKAFNSYVESKTASLLALENELKALNKSLESQKQLQNEQRDNLMEQSNEIAVHLESLKQKEASISQRIAELEAKDVVLAKREADLDAKIQSHIANSAALDKAKQDFESEKISTKQLAEQTAKDKADVDKKIETHKNLVLETSRLRVDASQKIEALKAETQKNQQSIAELTTLKEQLMKLQGDSNA